MKTVLATLLAAALLAAAAGALVVRGGLYDVSATSGHTGAVYRLLETTMHHSVAARAAAVEPPPLDGAARIERGAACYRDHCVQCHGGPGVAQGEVGKSLQPLPGPLVDAARRWQAREIYWITRHGIKMSGMPAWQLRLSDDDLWAVTAFVQHLAALSPAAYAQAMEGAAGQVCRTVSQACEAGACPPSPGAGARPPPGGQDGGAALALRQYACIACHSVPGVTGPETHVGPPLDDLWRRDRIAGGRLPATVEGLALWLRRPQAIDPATAMPDMGVTDEHARLMAEYLLRAR